MKKTMLLVILAALVVLTSGCAIRSGGGRGWVSSLVVPPILTVVLTNNTVVPLEIYENGNPVVVKNPAGQWQTAILQPGEVVSRGYYNFLGRRDIVITVRGICPPTPEAADTKTAGCEPGQYAGTATRRFYLYTDGQYHTDYWEIDYLRGPRGVH